MAKKRRIAIINADDDSARCICAAAGVADDGPQPQIFADPDAAAEYLAGAGASVVFFGIDRDPPAALAAVRKYVENRPASGKPASIVIGVTDRASSDLILDAVRSGVDEFLSPPLNEKTIRECVQNACKKKGILQAADSSNGGKVFTVFSGKGGCGKTMLATNLAYHLAQIGDATVVIVDLNLQFGNAAMFLDLQPRHTIIECLHGDGVVEDETLIRMPCKHSPRLSLIAGPDDPADSEQVHAQHIRALLSAFRQKYDFVIVDTSSNFDDFNLTALDMSDKIVLVSDTLVPAVRTTQRCLKVFEKLGYDNDKIVLVINRCDKRVGAGPKELQQAFDGPIAAFVPNAFNPVMTAVDAGLPIAEASEKSDVVSAIVELAFGLEGGEHKSQRSQGIMHKLTELIGK